MRAFSKTYSRWSGVWRAYLFAAALLLVAASLVYTVILIRRLEEEPRIMSRVFARFCMTAAIPEAAGDSPETGIIFEEVIQKINFPVIVTDQKGMPLAWRGIGVEPFVVEDQDFAGWDSLSPKNRLYPLKKAMGELAGENKPIALVLGEDSTVVGYVHYGQPRVLRELRYLPFLQVGMIALFVWVGFMGFRAIKVNEERAVWVGLAREAAHQLGTPISSLMGWLALLRDGSMTPSQVIPEMESDLAHLGKVLNRFNQIGSVPKLKPEEVGGVLEETVSYLEHRARSRGRDITFIRRIGEGRALLNRDLFGWAVENIIKNSIEAIEAGPGLIEIDLWQAAGRIEIAISDNGRGIAPKHQKKIFTPGFTTKTMGWGLGLSLVRRIVEDYHGGRVRLVSSRPGSGTSFSIQLPSLL
jgi:hypothetical protein